MSKTTPYIAAQTLTIISAVLIASFTFLKGRKRNTSTHFAFYNLAIASWAFCWIQMAIATSLHIGKFWAYFLHVPAAFIPPSFLNFVFSMTEFENINFKKKLVGISYVIASGFALLTLHKSFFIASVANKIGVNYFPTMGPAYPYFILFFLLIYASSLLILLVKFKKSIGSMKTQVFYVLIAYVIAFFGGTQAFLPQYDFDQPNYAFFLIPIAQGIIAYAIFRHQLLETRIVIRRLALIISIYTALILITIPFLYWFHSQIASNPTVSYSFFESLFVGGILSVGPFLYATFIKSGSYFKEHTMSGLTHELKSPLAIIENALEAIQNSSDSTPAANNSEYMSMMERNLSRLRSLVNDLLIVFGNKDLTMSLKKEPVQVAYLIDEAIKIHADAAKSKGIDLKKTIQTGITTINCDANRIVQVLSNLISNSLKFTKNGFVEIKVEIKNDLITLCVSDTGTGIDHEDLPYIFDRFYQGKKNQNSKGTGIGLSIAKIWIEAHGGKIWAEPEAVGTKIFFNLLPYAK